MSSGYHHTFVKYTVVSDETFYKLSTLLVALPAWQIRECLETQDNNYLLRLSNKSLLLEHFEVCAVIASMLQERMK